MTRDRVLNQEATRIGSTFGNLVIHGYDIEQSLRIARKRSLANFEYFVVGDGTYKLAQPKYLDPCNIHIKTAHDEKYFVSVITNSVRTIGSCNNATFMIQMLTGFQETLRIW